MTRRILTSAVLLLAACSSTGPGSDGGASEPAGRMLVLQQARVATVVLDLSTGEVETVSTRDDPWWMSHSARFAEGGSALLGRVNLSGELLGAVVRFDLSSGGLDTIFRPQNPNDWWSAGVLPDRSGLLIIYSEIDRPSHAVFAVSINGPAMLWSAPDGYTFVGPISSSPGGMMVAMIRSLTDSTDDRMAVFNDRGETVAIHPLVGALESEFWGYTLSGDGRFVLAKSGTIDMLYRLRVSDGRLDSLRSLPGRDLMISPDGRFAAVTRRGQSAGDTLVIQRLSDGREWRYGPLPPDGRGLTPLDWVQ
jgi:hypothetical protein